MKAHSNRFLTLLVVANFCCSSFTVFCADTSTQLNRKKRDAYTQRYKELQEQKDFSLSNYQEMGSISNSLKNAHIELLAKNPKDVERNSKIRHWHACELLAEHAIILNELKNQELKKEQKHILLIREHNIAHNLKNIYLEEEQANPSNITASKKAQEFMAQSIILGQITSLTPTEIYSQNNSATLPATVLNKNTEKDKSVKPDSCIIL